MNEKEYALYERRQRQRDKWDAQDESPNQRFNRLLNYMGKMKEIAVMIDEGASIQEVAEYIHSINNELTIGESLTIAHNLVVQSQSPL